MWDYDLEQLIKNLEFINSLNNWDILKIGWDYVRYQGRGIENSLLRLTYLNEEWNQCFMCFGFDDMDKEQFKRIDFDEEIERIKKIKNILI